MLDGLALKVKTTSRTLLPMTELKEDLSGRVAIVTGATGGIGKEIARGLARMGASVILTARTPDKGEQARVDIQKDAKTAVVAMVLDVSSQSSIRSFVADFEKSHDALHILVNNAGAWFTDRRESVDGYELTLATNVLGPYLLTKLLADRLRAGAPSRVVNVVSSFAGNYDAADLGWQKRAFDGFKAYGQSKQALRMLTWAFADKLEKDKVAVNAAAPGFVKTDFNQNARGFMASMINLSSKLFAVSPAEGADTPLWVAASHDLDGATSKYFDKRKDKDGKFRDPAALAELDGLCNTFVTT
jgi:NAD(P)-dependent dehydrogenase (short-subunit alcohol dehydrogenase family)